MASAHRPLRVSAGCLLAAALWLAMPARAEATDPGGFGLGLIVGDPTGVSMKGFLSQDVAIDGAIGFGILGRGHFMAQADMLWHFDIQRWPEMALDLYLGVGPRVGIRDRRRDDELLIGGRGPIGIALAFSGAPFDVFLEAAAGLWLVERFGFDVDAAIGARYWF